MSWHAGGWFADEWYHVFNIDAETAFWIIKNRIDRRQKAEGNNGRRRLGRRQSAPDARRFNITRVMTARTLNVVAPTRSHTC